MIPAEHRQAPPRTRYRWLGPMVAALSLAVWPALGGQQARCPTARLFGPAARGAADVARKSVASRGASSGSSGRARTITISAVGDCALGNLHGVERAPGSFARRLAEVDAPLAYPFAKVAPLLGADDLTIANLEGTLTTAREPSNHVYAVRGAPANAAMLHFGGVALVDLDNNHSGDYGPTGYADTRRALERAAVGYFGRGRIDRREVVGLEVVNLGYRGGTAGVRPRMVRQVAREAARGAVVIVSFHWGVEGYYATHPLQYALGRAAIDAGAALVIGHHPHVLQGIERYRGRTIAYSLGNFVFGANSQPADTDSIILQQSFTVHAGQITTPPPRIVPVRISTARSHNDFQPLLLHGAEAARVRAKMARLRHALLPAPTATGVDAAGAP